jgi:hypothetical protein
MARDRILVPYNFSPQDAKAVDFVARYMVRGPDTEVTLFHAHAPLPEFDTGDKVVTGKLKENLSYLKQKIKEQESALGEAVERLVHSGFSRGQVKCVFRPRRKDVACDIIEMTHKEGVQTLVLNRLPGRITRYFTQSVSGKVMSSLKNVTVCVVT